VRANAVCATESTAEEDEDGGGGSGSSSGGGSSGQEDGSSNGSEGCQTGGGGGGDSGVVAEVVDIDALPPFLRSRVVKGMALPSIRIEEVVEEEPADEVMSAVVGYVLGGLNGELFIELVEMMGTTRL